MKNYSEDQDPGQPEKDDAETDQLGGSLDERGEKSDESDTDAIPDDFFGVKDAPQHDGSSSWSPVGRSTPITAVTVVCAHQSCK